VRGKLKKALRDIGITEKDLAVETDEILRRGTMK